MADTKIPPPGKQPVPPLSQPAPIPPAPTPEPPTLSKPAVIPFEKAPKLDVPDVIPTEPAPALTAPAVIPFEPAPPLTKPPVIPLEPAPQLSIPIPPAFEPAPPLTKPPVIPLEPAPILSIPAVIPTEPAPPLSIPPVIPTEPAPILSVPVNPGPQPAPNLSVPAVIPTEPAPPLSVPAVIPPEPAPILSVPETIPLEPPPILSKPEPPPKMLPPQLSVPSTVVYMMDVPSQERWSDIIARAEAQKNSVGGVIQGIGRDALAAAMSISVTAGVGLNIPGLGMLPAGITIGPSGVAASFPIRQFTQMAADRAITFAKARAQAFLQAQVAALSQKLLSSVVSGLGLPEGLLTNLTPGQAVRGIPNTARNAPGGALIEKSAQQQFGAVPSNHAPPSTTLLPNETIEPADSTYTYASDSRQMTQAIQQAAAEINDQTMDQLNNWNDVSTYRQVTTEKESQGLQNASGPVTDGALLGFMRGADFQDDAKGYFDYKGSDGVLPSDDAAYVPLVFTDLRPNNGIYRTVYFRPFIKSLSENFAPNWNKANYFGRVDPVMTYKSTDRTINLGFTITCFHPEDLATNFRKLAWLNSMCYPQYSGGAYFAGPVIRLRVGDIISALGGVTGRGISGVITNLDLNYDQAIWELTRNSKLPRTIEVNLGFQVLHDRAVGILHTDDGPMFGGVSVNRADVRRFRAAFGSVEYLNEAEPLSPGLASMPIPEIMPQNVELPEFNPPDPDIPDVGVQQAQDWAGLDVDSSLGTLV